MGFKKKKTKVFLPLKLWLHLARGKQPPLYLSLHAISSLSHRSALSSTV